MEQRKVAITGIGCITPFGVGGKVFAENLLGGKSSIRKIRTFDASGYDTDIAAEVLDFNPTDFWDAKSVKRHDRVSHLSIAAARMALKDAGLDGVVYDPANFGVVMGTGIGGLTILCRDHKNLLEFGPGRVSPFYIPASIVNMPAGLISMEFGLRGPNYVSVSACASSTHAIGLAMEHIRYGRADAMVTGGSEAAVIPLGLAGFTAMKALSTGFRDTPEKASRPFDKLRDGFIMGEGGAMLIIEEMEAAKKRGAKIYGELAGYGLSADAHHITAPSPHGEGAQIAMRMAVNDAGLGFDAIDHINAHGTSTPYNDPTETEAIKIVFGERAREIPINSTKSMIGHMLGASGAAEMAAAMLCAEKGMVHPTINQEVPDPECDLDYVPNVARKYVWKNMLLNSFGFGGQNACLVVKR